MNANNVNVNVDVEKILSEYFFNEYHAWRAWNEVIKELLAAGVNPAGPTEEERGYGMSSPLPFKMAGESFTIECIGRAYIPHVVIFNKSRGRVHADVYSRY